MVLGDWNVHPRLRSISNIGNHSQEAIPQPKENEVLVKLTLRPINPADLRSVQGRKCGNIPIIYVLPAVMFKSLTCHLEMITLMTCICHMSHRLRQISSDSDMDAQMSVL